MWCFPSSSHWGLLTAMTFQIWQSVAGARQLHQSNPSGTWDTFYWVPWTSVCSGSSVGPKPHLHFWWEGLPSFSQCLEGSEASKMREERFLLKTEAKRRLNTSAFSDVTIFVLSMRGGGWYIFFPLPFLAGAFIFFTSLAKYSSNYTLAFLIASLHRPHPCILPKMYVPGSAACAFSSHTLVWLGGTYSAMLLSCLPFLISYTEELRAFAL